VEFRLLGRFGVRRAGREIAGSSFGGRRVRQLVQVLLRERGRVVPRDVLVEALWPERVPADPEANLAVLASRARRALGESSLILACQGGYVFADDDRCWVDAEAFAAAAERGRVSLAAGDAAAALGSYRSIKEAWPETQAASSHRGDPDDDQPTASPGRLWLASATSLQLLSPCLRDLHDEQVYARECFSGPAVRRNPGCRLLPRRRCGLRCAAPVGAENWKADTGRPAADITPSHRPATAGSTCRSALPVGRPVLPDSSPPPGSRPDRQADQPIGFYELVC
jgi:hypothetical protein